MKIQIREDHISIQLKLIEVSCIVLTIIAFLLITQFVRYVWYWPLQAQIVDLRKDIFWLNTDLRDLKKDIYVKPSKQIIQETQNNTTNMTIT